MKQSELLSAFIEQSRLISEIARQFVMTQTDNPLVAVVERLQKTVDKQQETLDRIVTAKFDRPMERIVHPVESDQMSIWALNDQGDVRPDDPMVRAIDNLHVESDEVFLKAAE